MRRLSSGILVLTAVAAWSLLSAGQVAISNPGTAGPGRVQHPAHLPYTAEFKTTRVQTLADGSTITHETKEVLARDSQGRILNASSGIALWSDDAREYSNVNINDPVSKTHTFWSTPGQRVYVTNNPDPGTQQPCSVAAPGKMLEPAEAQREKPKVEDLGKQTFEGVEAHGNRTTWTVAPGTIGNSDLLVHSSEVWFTTTPGLEGINVRQVNDDPRTGKETRELVKFTPGEPDAALFQPPQDFPVQIQETHSEIRCQ